MNIICFVLGVIVGVVVTVLLTKPKCAGVLKMYKIEPDEPASLFLDLDMFPDDMHDGMYVTFKVSLK